MHLADHASSRLTTSVLLGVSTWMMLSTAASASDRTPLIGTGGSTIHQGSVVQPLGDLILSINPDLVPCPAIATFSDLDGGPPPGTNYDGIVSSGGLFFAERFLGQSIGAFGDFDAVTGTPSNPLTPQIGLPLQNLDVFDYAGNVLTGLGPIGYDDIDAIGEGAISIYFPVPQSMVRLDLVGGNGGDATLSFYRANGSLIEVVNVSGLADLPYGFATSDGSSIIAGILVQNTDPSGIGIDNVCHDPGPVPVISTTWGSLKAVYR